MERQVTDREGITWSCIQAFAGLGNDAEKVEAARVEGSGDRLHVVCTPSGGSRSVRLELPAGWQDMGEGDLLAAIQARLDEM